MQEPSRADARRNRAKVLAAAQAAFAREGVSVSLGEIARRAGVGAGTVYRHFPTKEALIEAALAQRIGRLAALAEAAAQDADPGEAFFAFLAAVATSTPPNNDMCALMEGGDGWPRTVLLSTRARFNAALDALLVAAHGAGAVRAEVGADGVRAIIAGAVAMQRMQTDHARLAPTTALVIDALRAGGAGGPGIRYGTGPDGEKRNAARGCENCARPLDRSGPGRPPRFCGSACRQQAYRRRRAARARTASAS